MTLTPLTSDLLEPVRHGFFTRQGGASSGVFQGLNCGNGSTDQADIVRINRARVAEAMGVEAEALHTVRQIHSAKVAVIETDSPVTDADAMVTATPGLAIGILTADCMPILMADTQAGVVAATHAGWKGALGGIIENTVAAMERLGADRGRISASIGPAISQSCYEVGPEMLDDFLMEDDQAHRFFAQGQGDRLHFDLPGFGLRALRTAGVAAAEWTRHCTYRDADRFFSYRRATHAHEADYGRLISCIRVD